MDSDRQVFNVLNQSLSLESGSTVIPMKTIPEDRVSSLGSAGGESVNLPENPVPSPVYYPATSGSGIPRRESSDSQAPFGKDRKDSKDASDKSILALREHCSSRQPKCSCDVIILYTLSQKSVSATLYFTT